MNNHLDIVEMAGLGMKFVGPKSKKHILISAGKMSDKETLFPSIQELSKLNIQIYATKGTSRFFSEKNLPNIELYKVGDDKQPNIKSLLDTGRFDLIINILTGDNDYDETTDSKLIRSLAIQHGIPLITDVDVVKLTIDELIKNVKEGIFRYKLADKNEPWNLHKEFLKCVQKNGGYANYHGHFDKAYLISLENLKLSQADMQKKWELYKYLKENYTHEDLVERISRATEVMINQGVTYCRTMVDADSTVKLLPITAALEVKEKYKDRICLEIGVQALEGVLNEEARKYFEQACEMADFVGGLPSKDRPMPEKHIDIIMQIAKRLGKRLDVHVDQENNPNEKETELLALKTIEHGMQGRVSAVHSISLSAQSIAEQERIIRLLKEAEISVIICPSAALSMKQLPFDAPLHNSIAPFVRLLEGGVKVYLGVDNIADLFMPVVDGDMWTECRMLMETNRYYDIEKIAEIACDKSGFDAK
jgi:cytosine deaminase